MFLKIQHVLGIIVGLFAVEVSSQSKINYPKVRRDDRIIDNYFGTEILDPYQWLEDLEANETLEFIRNQNNLTFAYIQDAPSRSQIRETLTRLWTYHKEGLPKKKGDNYFIHKNSGIQNQWVFYKSKTIQGLYTEEAEVFFDPNTLSEDGTVSLKKITFSRNNELIAYTLSKSGSDWTTIHIKNATSGKDFPEVLRFSKFSSIEWTHDSLGFFYTRYPEQEDEENLVDTNENEMIYYHHVGTPQSQDSLVIEFPANPDWSLSVEVSDCGKYVIVGTSKVINEIFLYYANIVENIKDGFKKKIQLTQIVKNAAAYSFIGNDGPIFYFMTNEDAPNYKIIGMDVNNPEKAYWATIVQEHKRNVINWAVPIASDKLLISYTRDVISTLELRNLANGTLLVEYPLIPGSISSTQGSRRDLIFYFKLNTFTNPGITYKLDFGSDGKNIPRDLELYRTTAFKGLDTDKFETKQEFYESQDGTRVPMFIVKRKDLKLNSEAPCLLYGYGGFASSLEPFFSVGYLSFVSMFNGVLAFPNIRGGNEYGTKWWNDGRLLNKHKVFEDFIFAAKHLIAMNYTNPSKLAIEGASNGGLLVAACMNLRPDLFGAGLPGVGVMDMLRFQKFTVGAFWCGEYGCSDNRTHFNNLIKYSPLHNIKKNTIYPAVFVTTADHDDRVVPLHSFKYISELQHTVGNYEKQIQPLLIRIEEKAGHGAGKPTWKQIEETVDSYSFLQKTLGYTFIPQENKEEAELDQEKINFTLSAHFSISTKNKNSS